ncbi:lipase [Kalamiella sp. sgz302252]|uniref:lipase n=1 Tax=Pantoea sp. sgz302252 TaxID=3341827 RepID=UPI0036D3CBBF
MAIFDYKGETDIQLIKDVLTLESVNFGSATQADYSFNSVDGWKILDAETLGYSGCANKYGAFFGESLFTASAECSVLGKYDASGNLISIGLSFWGTGTYAGNPLYVPNTVLDWASNTVIALDESYSDIYIANAYNNLLSCISSFATANGLSGSDIIFTGHSLGGLSVNSMATASAQGKWEGFFEDSSYIALASPTQNLLDDKVLNVGYEGDPVFRVLEGSSLTWESPFSHDKPLETATNNIVTFNDYYAGLTDGCDIMSIVNISSWASHSGQDYSDGMLRIMDSEIYSYTHIDSNIVVSNLSEENRSTTWVQDLNKSIEHQGSTFIIGTASNDLLQGGANNDYLCGGAGNDTFKDHSGYNVIYGGEGENTYITECIVGDINFARNSDGTLFFKYSNGDITKAEDIHIVNADKPFFSFLDLTLSLKTDFTVTEYGLQDGSDILSYAQSYYATEENSFTLIADSDDNWLFAADTDSIIYANGSHANIVSGYGNDTIYASGSGDSLLFYGDFGNDTIFNLSGQETFIFMENEFIADNDSYLNHLSFVDDNAVLTFGDSSVTLTGVNADSLADMHFIVA